MWLTFYADLLCVLVFLYIPGYFLGRGLRADAGLSVAVGPMLSIAVYALMGIAYGMLGIPCSWLTMAVPTALVGALLWGVGRVRGVEPHPALCLSEEVREAPIARWPRLSYIRISYLLATLTGLVVTFIIFVNSLPTPDSFVQNYDNAWHLTRIAQFLNTGNYSSLVGARYPSAWHAVAAMAGSAVGATAPIAENAANAALAAVVYPLGSMLLLATLYHDKPRRVVIGGAFCLSIAYFPWRIMLYGPLFPNMASFEVMPVVAALFIILVRDARGVAERMIPGLFFVLGGIALALLQPNGIFSCGVFLIPFCLSTCRRLVSERRGLKAGLLAELGLLAFFVALWLALDYAPQLHDVVWYERAAPNDWDHGIKWAMALNFIIRRFHLLLGSLVILGAVVLLWDNERRWITLSYLMTAGLYVVAFGVAGIAKNLIAGFWYADYWRLAAATCVFAIPVLACGVDAALTLLTYPLTRLEPVGRHSTASKPRRVLTPVALGIQVLLVVLTLTYNYYPFEFVPWEYRVYAFDTVRHNFTTTYDIELYEWAPLTSDEVEFLDKVSEVVPAGEPVLNMPFDGSVFGYSICGINVTYPMYAMDPTGRGSALKKSINKIAKSEKLQQQAREMGVHYLLQLDQGTGPMGMNPKGSFMDLGYDKKEWKGINAVRDDTPGFTVVLSEGDMRLYKIDAVA